MKIVLLVDCDATIAVEDTTDRTLECFVDPAWREVENDWVGGRISTREYTARKIELVRASAEGL